VARPTLLLASRRQRRLALLVAVLTLGFGLTATLAWQAQASARSHRDTAVRTLTDYAGFAAMQFAFRATESVYATATRFVLRPVDPAVGITGHELVRQTMIKGCPGSPTVGKAPRFFFSLDLQTRELIKARGCIDDTVRGWLRDTVAKHALAKLDRRWEHMEFVAPFAGARWLIVYAVRFDAEEHPVAAFGFATPFNEFARPVFASVMKEGYPLLPPTLVGKRTTNDSLLSVRVTDQAGATIYESPVQYESPYWARYEYPKFGAYTVTLTIRPEVADKLVIGGLPRSRLPFLLGLLALAGALTVVALYQLRREADLARLRNDFISSISHELRTPLAQVRMFAETLLLDRVRSEGERRRSLEIIDQEARRLTHLVENVLQFSRNERSVTRLSPEPTDVACEVREVVESFQPIAAARGVSLATQLGDGCTTEVDRAALRQVLLNFLDNAVKYGAPGQTVTVGARCQPDALELWVDDQGPGIPARERERVWEPFQRLERDANSAVAGSGIGLSVVRDLVTLHGGRAWVEDAPGGGARFAIRLPRHESPADGAGTTASPDAALESAGSRTPRPRAGV
jgi:signal transduction histidine kinase